MAIARNKTKQGFCALPPYPFFLSDSSGIGYIVLGGAIQSWRDSPINQSDFQSLSYAMGGFLECLQCHWLILLVTCLNQLKALCSLVFRLQIERLNPQITPLVARAREADELGKKNKA